ncbi:S8 family serine peptidase [Wenzhouxiangella sp. AB-CW3]|uniref:S8 family serine peptidase n=1 Tax=Wenzhouxiangella sp. AB-CW3 TaxID=2771012 RepID=UPI00168BECC8|nr:S8 family serine peptidase [Wenzhouxiangella sp. AB-CW3]QOC22525.1 S8 family serine peptidase [Wenzhouxiangella sp. AB-CW3]
MSSIRFSLRPGGAIAAVLAFAMTAGVAADTDALTAEDVSASMEVTSSGQIAPADRQGRYLYIVRFEEPSLARYEGGIRGLAPTSPRATGQRINTRSSAAVAYREFLAEQQESYLQAMGQTSRRSLTPERQFLNVLNGMTLRLTQEEAEAVARLPFVAGIEPNRIDELHTDEGPDLINAPDVWAGSTISGLHNRGEGIIIGILDTGFNFDHPSFAEEADDGHVHDNPYGDGVFTGLCADPSASDYEDVCNNKVIGTYNLHPLSTSSDDTDNHGTHVASTAAGNPLDIVFPFNYLDLDVDISGVAPRANLINYKVCEPTCPADVRIAAVDHAVNDGVHVLNHSISNSEPPWASAVSLAFLDANAAGIVVAASAGNSGPGASTAASTGPWNIAVGASTHQRLLAVLATIGTDTEEYRGSPFGAPLTGAYSGDLRYAGDVDSENSEGCDAFPADAFDGEAALIRRGGCTFAEKVDNAVDAGANFVVIANNESGIASLGGLGDAPVPVLSVADSTGDAFIDEIDGDVAVLDVEAIIEVDSDNADIMANFSSRGPASHNVIAPAVTAPGVQILAGARAESDDFVAISGTSMSSPHVAGAAALLAHERPTWTPTEIRSALTLSANPDHLKEDGSTPADPFDMGSGRIDVAAAADVGFVMDESIANFEAANPADGGNPATLNLSSIKESECFTECSFQRTIRSVVADPVEYTITTTVPSGISIDVTPSSFTLGAGATQSLNIEIDVTGVPFDQWNFADIHIEEDGTTVGVSNARMPVALISREPAPAIAFSPESLSVGLASDAVASHQFDILNVGQEPLEWELSEQGPQNVPGPVVSTVIWDNPQAGTSGRINNFATAEDTGIYQTDAFVLLAPSSIETIFSVGFTLGSPDVSGLNWMVFADDDGVPAGHPETDPGSAIWSFSAEVGDPGVGFVDANMSLDLDTAGAPPLELEPGVYWLTAYPDVDEFSLGPNNLYAWFHGESGAGREIGPGGLAGWPPFWFPVPEGRAFTLTGTVDCSEQFNPWTNVSPTSGTIDPDEHETVNVDFYATGLKDGSYRSAFCVLSNDPERPVTLMPVQLNVAPDIFHDAFEADQ